MNDCKITLQDDTSIASTNDSSQEDLDNFQKVMTEQALLHSKRYV